MAKDLRTIQDLMNLDQRSAIITGGAGHIGLAAAESMMELGAKVTIFDLDEKACKARCAELNSRGYKQKALFIALDIADEKALRKAVQEAAKEMKGIDILLHAAAFVGTTKYPGWVVPFPEQTVDAWDAAMRVNLTSAFILVQEAETYLLKSKHNSVIFISSTHGIVAPDMSLYEGTPMGNPAAYGVSKAGLIHLAKYLSAVRSPDLKVNCICPGGVWRNHKEEFHGRYKKRTPMNRMASEEDFKGAVAYLASELSSYVRGHNLVVDGGYTTW